MQNSSIINEMDQHEVLVLFPEKSELCTMHGKYVNSITVDIAVFF